jgi:hypothetical protein
MATLLYHPEVFISSTKDDLKEYRLAARDAVISMEYFPSMMEYFPALDEQAVKHCIDSVDQAAVYIGIFAHRYGSIPSKAAAKIVKSKAKDISITEMEFDRATDNKIPRLCFLVDDKLAWPPQYIEGEPGRSKLQKFIQNKIDAALIRNTFTTPESLELGIVKALCASQPRAVMNFEIPGHWVISYITVPQVISNSNGEMKAKVHIRLEENLENFNPDALRHALGQLLEISPDQIRIRHFTEGSVWVSLEMPESAALLLHEVVIATQRPVSPPTPSSKSLLRRLLDRWFRLVFSVTLGIVVGVIVTIITPPRPPNPLIAISIPDVYSQTFRASLLVDSFEFNKCSKTVQLTLMIVSGSNFDSSSYDWKVTKLEDGVPTTLDGDTAIIDIKKGVQFVQIHPVKYDIQVYDTQIEGEAVFHGMIKPAYSTHITLEPDTSFHCMLILPPGLVLPTPTPITP